MDATTIVIASNTLAVLISAGGIAYRLGRLSQKIDTVVEHDKEHIQSITSLKEFRARVQAQLRSAGINGSN